MKTRLSVTANVTRLTERSSDARYEKENINEGPEDPSSLCYPTTNSRERPNEEHRRGENATKKAKTRTTL